MRAAVLVAIFALMGLCSSSPINPERRLVNRPTLEDMFRGTKTVAVKGHHGVINVKGGAPLDPESRVRKGEFLCGDKICQLQPGEVPKGCTDHICQYPIALDTPELYRSK